jgi:hypothetical protein
MGFRVMGLRVGVAEVLGLWIKGFGFRVYDLGFKLHDSRV